MTQKYIQLVLLIALAGSMSTLAAQGQPAPRRIEIMARRFAFDQKEITLKKGEPVVLVLKSDDVAHGLRFRELNIDLKVRPHGATEVQFTPNVTGDFVGHCGVFCGSGHGSMTLTIHVVE